MLPGFLATLDSQNELPAAVSAASAAAITAVTVPASTTAAAATTAARSPSAAPAKAAAATTAPRSSSAATATLTRRPGFVDDNIAAHEIVAIQSLDGALGFLVAIDLDKSEPAGLP
jgi:hypothetical protein